MELSWDDATKGVVSGVLRDDRGALLDGFTMKVSSLSPIQTEILALIEALKRFEPRRESDMEDRDRLC